MMENEPNKKLKQDNNFDDNNNPNGHEKEEPIEYVGLRNQGNTCYMNSYLQTLFHLSEFSRLVLKIPTPGNHLKFPDSMQILFNGLYKEDRPQGTLDLIKSFGWDREDAFNQQDVQEFSCNIIEVLESKVDKYEKLKGEIQRLFQGIAKNYIRCKNVNFSSERDEQFFDIQLNVKGKKNIYESLQEYTSEELMSEDNQYDTGDPQFGRQDAIKGIKFQKLPPILQMTLKRFDYDYQKMRLVKILDKYDYPTELDMFEFMDNSVNPEEQRDDFVYTLYAVLIHSGKQSGSGHYYVFINKLKNWYKFNDSQVEIISEEEVLQGGEGGEQTEKKFNQRLERVEEITIQKKETAYMLVYVQKKQAKQILRDLVDNDIPPQIKNYYDKKKQDLEIQKRNREYFSVKIFSYNQLTELKGNAIVFQKDFANSYVSIENLENYGKTIHLKRQIQLDTFLKKLSKQLKLPQSEFILYKVFCGSTGEMIVNLSHYIDKSMGSNLMNLCLQSKFDPENQDYALLILAKDKVQDQISLEDLAEEFDSQDDEDDDITAAVTPVAQEDEPDDQLKQQSFLVFYKILHKSERLDEMNGDSDYPYKNQLMGYVLVTLWDTFENTLRKIAKQLNHSVEYLNKNYRFYKENKYQSSLIDEESKSKTVYQIFVNRYYGVLVLDQKTNYSSQEKHAEIYYQRKTDNYQITFEPILGAEENAGYSQTLELQGEQPFEYVQRFINESYYKNKKDYEKIYFQYFEDDIQDYKDFQLDEDSTIKQVDLLTKLRFGYDENLKATVRGSCIHYKFLLMDHSSSEYIINKPAEKSLIISQQSLMKDFVKLVEENPSQFLQYTEKDNLDRQVQMSVYKKRNPHSLQTSINMNNRMDLVDKIPFYKYLYILERPYNSENDFLIAGQFMDTEGSSFAYPFLMVVNKDILISELYTKLQLQFKNKKINKFFDSDIQSTIQKFDAVIIYSDSYLDKFTVTEDCEDTLESKANNDEYNKNNKLAMQIKIYGIDLSTNIKRIQSSQN